jgi:putative ABC transport system permease protein
MQHLRYALRTLGRTPLFTTAAVLTIAIAIGANTAIFSLVDATLLRGTPGVRDEKGLASISIDGRLEGGLTVSFGVPYRAFLTYSRAAARVQGVAAYQQDELNMGTTAAAGAQRVHAELVSDNYFRLLGTRAAAGRLLDSAVSKNEPTTATISHRLWQRVFSGDANVIGKAVILNGNRFTIAGVAEPNFVGIDPYNEADVWLPASATERLAAHGGRPTTLDAFSFGRVVARLGAGVSIADVEREAAAALDSVKANLFNPTMTLVVHARAGIGVPDDQRRQMLQTVWILVIGVALVLVIACANVANLFLARGATRVREIALRRSLGADDWALVRQVVVESLVVSVAAGVIGVVLALWGTALLEGFKLHQNMPTVPAFSVDGRVLVFAALLSVATAALFALPPVIGTMKADASVMLRNGDRAVTRRSRTQGMLVIAQVAVSFALVVGAALFVRTVHNLRSIDLGFRPENVIGVSMDLGAQGYSGPAASALLQQLVQRLRARPQLQSVSLTELAPFDGLSMSRPRPAAGKPAVERQFIGVNAVSDAYFKTLGIVLRQGRDFTASEGASNAPVAIVSAQMAKEFWPGRDPIGQRIVLLHDRLATVVGVTRDSRALAPQAPPEPHYYTPLSGANRATVLIRSTADRAAIVSDVRREVAALDRNLPIYDILSIAERVDRSFAEQIATARLTSLFGLVGLVLAVIGLYAVISFTVTQRTRELAIRVALGARDAHVRGHVLGDALRLVVVGLVIGGASAYELSRLVSNRFYGVSGFNIPTYLAVAVAMIVVAVAASYPPARRATMVDPMTALRAD